MSLSYPMRSDKSFALIPALGSNDGGCCGGRLMNFYVASVATLWTTAMGMRRPAPLTTGATRPICGRSETCSKVGRSSDLPSPRKAVSDAQSLARHSSGRL